MVSRLFRALPLGRVRLAMYDDIPAILGIVNESMSLNFRVHEASDVAYLIDNCLLTICQLDINGTIVGCLAVKDHPLVPSVNSAAWEDFVWTKYKCVELNSRNTLFLHLLCWNPIYARELVDNMLKSLFMHDPYLQFIAMMRCIMEHPLLVPGQSRSEASFRRVQAMERGVPGDLLPLLLVAERGEVSPRLRIRRAVEADNDDIVPIIEQHSARLRQLYGDFYVSELISRHPESERALLVCEHKEVAVGVMCLNTQINFEELEESFDLSPFAGLRHLEKVIKPGEEPVGSNLSLAEENKGPEKESSFTSSASRETKSRVTWIYDEDEFSKFKDQESRPPRHSQPGYSQIDILNLFQDEDEEEMEFEIVNIDPDLIKLPKYFYDKLGESYDDKTKIRRRESFYDNKYLDKDIGKKTSEFPMVPPAKPPEPTRYVGTSNAFLLELFAMHHDYDERYGFDMLEVAFELFPDRDYCVVSLPTGHTCFPLLEHFTLVTPFSSRMRFINETLFVAHVNSIRGDVRVRPAEPYDATSLDDVLENSLRKQQILDMFYDSFEIATLSSFVLLSQNQPIGLVILGPVENTTAIRAQYELEPEPFKFGTDAAILAGVMSPVMEPHGRWFLRDLIRHTKYTTLFYGYRLFAKGEASPNRYLMSLCSHMRPVTPRQFFPIVKGNKDLEMIFRPMACPFALWTLERPLTSLPKVYVNNSIVVVGASRTGLSFIEALFMGPTSQYLTFTNITLVSEHGLPTVPDCLRAAEICVPRDGRYTDRYIKSVPFYYYVDVLSGVMAKIDRKKKCIHLKDGGIKFYDELVLTCGQQYQHPDYLKESPDTGKEEAPKKFCDRILMDDPKYQPDRVPPPPDLPENVMLINSLFQANSCLRKLLALIKESKNSDNCLSEDNKIVVYGDCLEAYCCIAALLELGISAKMIAFIEPFPADGENKMRVNCFNNETVDERVQMSLNKLKIQVFRKTYLYGWWQKGDRVETIRLISPLSALHLPCFALFYYGLKAIDVYAFKAINESGLVYDGGVVVGPTFDTNDPHVFAAGTCVRYSRKLYADNRLHKYYTSEDVGEAMARMFLRKLDPFMTGVHEVESPNYETQRYSSSVSGFKDSHGSIGSSIRLSAGAIRGRWQPVPKFDAPIAQTATLPGPLYYLLLRRPGPEVPMAVQKTLPHQGHTLITDKNENYFCLQINALHTIDTVTCLSKKRFSSETFILLYGRHESYFNNLLARYELNLIEDFYDFFTKPWLTALYQESFADLLREIKERGIKTVHDVIRTKYSDFLEGKLERKLSSCGVTCSGDSLKECGQNAALRHEADVFWKSVGGEDIVVSHLATYLRRNNVTNPQYAMPRHEFI